MRSLEGANCADLPPQIIDKYFYCNVASEPLRAMAALAICGNCPVQQECRSEALAMPHLQRRGIVGGVRAAEVWAARRWRAYEAGATTAVPRMSRPEWLPISEAADAAEAGRLSDDPDEPDDYVFADQAPPNTSAFNPRLAPPLPPAPPRAAHPRRATQRADVPMPLAGANCGVMPSALVQDYFSADTLREPTRAALARLVCECCDVQPDCLRTVLIAGSVKKSGVIAGMNAREVRRGRAWLHHEAGLAALPSTPRPPWLPPPSDARQALSLSLGGAPGGGQL